MTADMEAGSATTYLLEQRFRYTYAAPARSLHHRLIVFPRARHGAQRRVGHGLTVSGSRAVVSATVDGFANDLVELRASTVDEWIEFETWATVELRADGGRTPVPAALGEDPRLTAPTPLTATSEPVAEVARDFLASGAHGLEIAERACTWTHEALSYEWGVTNVHTSATEALAGGRGVCQDYAHLMLALCRAVGLPARYVSGHLLGEGGSHAWVEVVVRDTRASGPEQTLAVAFDPTHERRAERGYVTVALGRDYADVAPTSGSFHGSAGGVLATRKRLGAVPRGHL